MNIHTLSKSLARPPNRSMSLAFCPEISISTPESCSFCLTNESELAVSASDNAIDCNGFDGRAIRNVVKLLPSKIMGHIPLANRFAFSLLSLNTMT